MLFFSKKKMLLFFQRCFFFFKDASFSSKMLLSKMLLSSLFIEQRCFFVRWIDSAWPWTWESINLETFGLLILLSWETELKLCIDKNYQAQTIYTVHLRIRANMKQSRATRGPFARNWTYTMCQCWRTVLPSKGHRIIPKHTWLWTLYSLCFSNIPFFSGTRSSDMLSMAMRWSYPSPRIAGFFFFCTWVLAAFISDMSPRSGLGSSERKTDIQLHNMASFLIG